jgi:hypothetical protein
MRHLVLLIAILGAGCLRKTEFFCMTSADCNGGNGGNCEGTGYCSYADTNCPMGQRYGDYAGSYSGKCVGEEVTMDDGGIDGPMDDVPPAGCPATYMTLAGAGSHVYKLTTGSAQWATQRDRCAADGNAYLAIPDDMMELQAITTAAANQAWVGISDIMTEGTFRTVKGATATYLPWAAGEPDDAMGGQDCVSALMTAPNIQTDKCSDTLPAVCECEP